MAFDLLAKIILQDKASATINKVEANMRNMNRAAEASNASIARMERAASMAGGTLKRMGSTGSSLVSSFTGIKAAVTGAAAAFGAFKVAESALKLSSDAETATIGFTTMLGSAEKAKTFLEDLTQFANNTPFELPQLRDASKKMLAYGFAAESILPMLTSVGDAAAGLGAGQAGIESITRALGQIRSNGRLNSEDMNQLTDVGVSAWSILAENMGQSEAQIRKLTEKGLIPADKAINALVDGMEKRFPHMMDAQSKSLSGMYSTMKDTFNNDILKRWGDGLANTLRPRFEQLNTWIKANGPTLDRWGAQIQAAASSASDAITRKFEGAFKYVKTHYFDNPQFTKIKDISGKVEYVIQSLTDSYNLWYSSGGDKQIEGVAKNVSEFLGTLLGGATQPMVDAGLKMGKSLGSGLIDGLNKTIEKHPILSSFAVAAATPGNPYVKGAAGLGAFTYSGFLNWKNHDRIQKEEGDARVKEFFTPELVDNWKKAFPNWMPPEQITGVAPTVKSPLDMVNRMSSGSRVPYTGVPTIDGTHAGGLSRVPYNGYVSVLHKDEGVLTKAENERYSEGRGGGGYNGPLIGKIADTVVIREDADIDRVARAIAREMRQYSTVVGY